MVPLSSILLKGVRKKIHMTKSVLMSNQAGTKQPGMQTPVKKALLWIWIPHSQDLEELKVQQTDPFLIQRLCKKKNLSKTVTNLKSDKKDSCWNVHFAHRQKKVQKSQIQVCIQFDDYFKSSSLVFRRVVLNFNIQKESDLKVEKEMCWIWIPWRLFQEALRTFLRTAPCSQFLRPSLL